MNQDIMTAHLENVQKQFNLTMHEWLLIRLHVMTLASLQSVPDDGVREAATVWANLNTEIGVALNISHDRLEELIEISSDLFDKVHQSVPQPTH